MNNNIREKLNIIRAKARDNAQTFLYGRNGNDAFNKFLFGACLVFLILYLFLKARFLFYISFALLIYSYFRMFSKNLAKRQSENAKYYQLRTKLFVYLKNIKERWVQRKDYKFFTCPSCKATLRVPKGRGKIKIVCRKCGNSFIGKS